ncbi:MAG: hypothetical protein ACRD1C_09855 [Terriglobales bacterium]
MAVHKQTYHGYEGPHTPDRRRVWVVHAWARKRVFQSRFLMVLFLICLLPPLIQLVLVYISNNFSFLNQFGSLHAFVNVDNNFFASWLSRECVFGFLFAAFAAPGLVSPDVINGGLSLYLARPLTRWEYMLGKFSVLFLLLSYLTWIPQLAIYIVQMSLAGAAWRAQFGYLGLSLVLASWIWITVLSLLALAISSWVRWKIIAAGALLAVDFLGTGFGAAINATLQTKAGDLFSFNALHTIVWNGLFRQTPLSGTLVAAAWLVLAAVAGISLFLTQLRVRGMMVVR